MADPARKIEPEDTGPTPLHFDVEQSGPQLKSTKITENGQSSAASLGPSVAANDNVVANDQGGAAPTNNQSVGQQSSSVTQPTRSPQSEQSTQPAGESKVNQSATTTPQDANAQVEPLEQGSGGGQGLKAEKSPAVSKEDGKEQKKDDASGVKKEAADSPDKGVANESDQQAKKQEGDANVAAQDSNSAKAAPALENRDAALQKNQNLSPAKTAQRQNPPLSAQPRPAVGRRNPLRPNTTTTQSAGRQNVPGQSTQRSNQSDSSATNANVTKGGASKSLASRAQQGMQKMAERQIKDEKNGDATTSKATEGPGINAKKSGALAADVANKANLEKQVAEAAARRAGAIAGGLGASKKTQENITVSLIVLINIIFLVLEVVSGIGILLFILHIVLFLYWLSKENRWKKSWLALIMILLSPFTLIFGVFVAFSITLLGFIFITCQTTANSIPFGIPISYVTSISSFFGANIGPFAQVCDHLNVHSLGVGGVANTTTRNANTPTVSTARAVGMIDGQVVLVDESGQTLTPVIANTQLVRPQPLAPEIANQANQAGYLSPASCKLGDIPFSDEVITRNVRLDNGQTKLVAFPIHKTIDCIKNDPAKTTVRSVQLGKVVRLVDDDSVLGKYVTVEYPNGLRVSYYHLAQITPTLALGSILNAGQPIGTMGNSGQISFEGTQMLFELKDANGNWKVFNPISGNGDASVLTTFPCADNAGSQCLLD
jgi:murein DD-endopeptidase MepM/ murein hydrolase activator NlpD